MLYPRSNFSLSIRCVGSVSAVCEKKANDIPLKMRNWNDLSMWRRKLRMIKWRICQCHGKVRKSVHRHHRYQLHRCQTPMRLYPPLKPVSLCHRKNEPTHAKMRNYTQNWRWTPIHTQPPSRQRWCICHQRRFHINVYTNWIQPFSLLFNIKRKTKKNWLKVPVKSVLHFSWLLYDFDLERKKCCIVSFLIRMNKKRHHMYNNNWMIPEQCNLRLTQIWQKMIIFLIKKH